MKSRGIQQNRKRTRSGAARIQHGDRAAVLRPAGDVVADRNRPFLAVGNRAHARAVDAAGDQIIARDLRAAGAGRDVVFARAALVGVTFDGEGITVVLAEPLRLLVEGGTRLRSELGRIGFEEDAVAHVHDEILRRAGHGGGPAGIVWIVWIAGTGGDHHRRPEQRGETQAAKEPLEIRHNGWRPLSTHRKSNPDLTARGLIEYSVNFDGTLA